VEQPASEVKKNNDIAAANIAEGEKIQQETEDKYLYYYRTVRMPEYVMEEIGRLAPRNAPRELKDQVVAVPEDAHSDLSYKDKEGKSKQEVRLIRVEYIEDSTEKTEAAAGSARGAQAAPVRERSVTVTITGLMNTVGGDRTATRIWVQQNFADKLFKSSLTSPIGMIGIAIDEGYANGDGVKLREAVKGGPADTAGMQKDDVIVEADGKAVTSAGELAAVLMTKKVDDTAHFKAGRGDKVMEFDVRVGGAVAEVKYMTDNYWNEGEVSEKPEKSDGQFTVFKISWQINPDSEYVPGNE